MGLTIAGWLISGLLGAFAATYYQSWLHQRERSRDVLARLSGNRHFLTGHRHLYNTAEPFISLNEIFIVFARYPDVISALKKYHRTFSLDDLLTIIEAMAAASRVPLDNVDGEFFKAPFTPPPPPLPLSANMTETPGAFGITVGRWR